MREFIADAWPSFIVYGVAYVIAVTAAGTMGILLVALGLVTGALGAAVVSLRTSSRYRKQAAAASEQVKLWEELHGKPRLPGIADS